MPKFLANVLNIQHISPNSSKKLKELNLFLFYISYSCSLAWVEFILKFFSGPAAKIRMKIHPNTKVKTYMSQIWSNLD